ncbi:uncharacterized protein LOC126687638 [Mercurialis annua]|uniref:uncharacterized protein LOC126687638 n=1 Tax=Mercurialis annua TaxID=3986 RepID=UPI0024AE379F|nr:uncharacterized protein LOC126687638 [Mercurialis annua]
MTYDRMNLKDKLRNASQYRNRKIPESLIPPPVTFEGEDFGRISEEHNEALVVAMIIEHWNMERILVDEGSAINPITRKAYESLGRDLAELKRNATPVKGFGGSPIKPIGTITYSFSIVVWVPKLSK